MGRRNWIGLLLALFAASAFARVPDAVRKQVEASMLVTGHVLIEPDGSVSGWEIDQREKLPPEVVGLVERSASAWRFEPVVVDGVQRKAKARMSLRVVVSQTREESYRIEIRSGYFGDGALSAEERRERASTDQVHAIRMRPPVYPQQAMITGVQGTVYLVLKIDRDGKVADIAVEQVNLRTLGTESEVRRMRTMLSNPATLAARKWTFRIPTTGESATKDHWSTRVPVDFVLHGSRRPQDGEWHAYLPGPRHPVPWLEEEAASNESPEALVAGGVYEIGKGRKLLTPLEGGG